MSAAARLPGAAGGILRGRTCEILGFGGIGRAVASLVSAPGVHVVALNSRGTTTGPEHSSASASVTARIEAMHLASPPA